MFKIINLSTGEISGESANQQTAFLMATIFTRLTTQLHIVQ